MRYRIPWLAATAALVLTGSTLAAPSFGTLDVTDYGRNRHRTHFTPQEPEFPLHKNARAVWEVPLGLSRSQPLIVSRDFNGDGSPETRIYHIAGDTLWALDGARTPSQRQAGQDAAAYRATLRSEGFVIWSTGAASVCSDSTLLERDELLTIKCGKVGARKEARPFSSSQASYMYGATPAQDVIYVGFGHPASLAAVRASDGKVLGAYVVDHQGDRGIVAAPLPYQNDTVVVGTTDGYVHIIRNLTSGAATVRSAHIGGRISSSPVPLGEYGFLMATDARQDSDLGSHGYLSAMSIGMPALGLQSFQAAWQTAVVTPAGIPGEVALDARTIYVADKFGKLYALALDSGQLLWCRQFPSMGPCSPGNGRAAGFINNGPAVDDERVYFVFRNSAGPNQGNGRIIALHKASGRLLWQQDLPGGKGTTAPVVMNHVVIVGDTGGFVSAFDKQTGTPIRHGGYPLRLTDIPYQEGDQGERWWEPIGGAATQMTVSHGLMLVGVNSRVEEETVLKAFRLFKLPDLYLQYLQTPASAEPGGFSIAVRPECSGCATEITATVSVTVNGHSVGSRTVTFTPGGDPVGLGFHSGAWPAGSAVEVVATIDPDNEIAESDEANNTLRATVMIYNPACCQKPGDRWGSELSG